MSNSPNPSILHILKIGILLCLSIGLSIHTQAQEVLPDAITLDEAGNIVILRGCNEHDFARFLNSTPRIARSILAEHGYTVEEDSLIVLNDGDTLRHDADEYRASDSLSCIGKFICRHSGSDLDKFLFSNYWRGDGDVELSGKLFTKILLCLKQSLDTLPTRPDSIATADTLLPYLVSFYDTPFERSFGYATVYVDSANRVVGFADHYDFDAKKWGVRPVKYEFCVRIVSLLSPPTAAGFKIYYDAKP